MSVDMFWSMFKRVYLRAHRLTYFDVFLYSTCASL